MCVMRGGGYTIESKTLGVAQGRGGGMGRRVGGERGQGGSIGLCAKVMK